MFNTNRLAIRTRINWIIDSLLFLSLAGAALSGVYFLIFAANGYQGGRNSTYDAAFLLFDRRSWDIFHTWTGSVMILLVVIHLVVHTKWIENMFKRLARPDECSINRNARFNLTIIVIETISFIFTAVSGVYFLIFPGSGHERILFGNRAIWDLMHTWAGVIFIVAVLIHTLLNWCWIEKVTRKIFHVPFVKDSQHNSFAPETQV